EAGGGGGGGGGGARPAAGGGGGRGRPWVGAVRAGRGRRGGLPPATGPGRADGDARRTRDPGDTRRRRRVRDHGVQRPGGRAAAGDHAERQPADPRRTGGGRL